MYVLDVGIIPCGSGAPTTALRHHLHSKGELETQRKFKIIANKSCGNGMMMDPSIDPQNMNDLNYFLYDV